MNFLINKRSREKLDIILLTEQAFLYIVRKRRYIMARHNTVQTSAFSSLEHLDMYENTVSGRDSTEAAYLQLRRAILRNELPSGKHLSQRELEQRFGVGRTPLREALRM